MEQTKYYTPSIDEFHIGFEYEWNSTNEDDEWRPAIADNEDCFHAVSHLINDIEQFRYRVKYLDREDIESLGWSYNSWSNVDNDLLIFNYKEYCLFEKGDNRWEITIPKLGIQADIGFAHYTIFNGKIKNKSELKKLMQQLQIQ